MFGQISALFHSAVITFVIVLACSEYPTPSFTAAQVEQSSAENKAVSPESFETLPFLG
jgi:hypothetical protein